MNQSRHSTAEVLGVLAGMGWLSEQPGDFQERIARAGRWITLPKGARLFHAGEPATAMFGLGEGLLDIAIPISEDEEVTVHRAPPGFWIGDGALLSSVPRQLSIEAATDCLVFRLPIEAVQRMLEAFPRDWMYFHRLSSLNATLAVRTLAEMIALPPRARFARLLLRIRLPDNTVRVTQEELGRMAGMSRAAFRRTFGSLIRSGAVETTYGGLIIRDAAALKQEANAR
jgi:CRP/FNR family transcriptional regulator, cyclic AMP receptor protein